MSQDIGSRVLESLEQAFPDTTRKQIASEVDMTPDAFSRALKGERAFSSIEVAKLAALLGVDLHWLITGKRDPHRLVVAARHDFDFATGERAVPGMADDQSILADIGLAYRQAYQGVDLSDSEIPNSVESIREILGPDFVRPFISRLESRMGVDVVRLAGLSTSYSIAIAGRMVIVIAATGNWFRENWAIAHELGHLASGHLALEKTAEGRADDEATANAFAAELLLPSVRMRETDWQNVSEEGLAERVWDLGVSTDALSRRLWNLGVPTSSVVSQWAAQTTQRLLRYHWKGAAGGGEVDEITERMDDASARRFPRSLQEAHLKMIANGDLGKGTLAWMLGIDADDLEVDAPEPQAEIDSDALAAELGL